MKVFDVYWGRLGNGLFRYFASTLFCILYKAKRIYEKENINVVFKDENFLIWSKELKQIKELEKKDQQMSVLYLQNFIHKMDEYNDLNFAFDGYFQHDIYRYFKNELIEWMHNHPDETVISDIENVNTLYRVGDILPAPDKLIQYPLIERYDVVIHVRLEDFVITERYGTNISKILIHPDAIRKIMKDLNAKTYCIISNKLKYDIEHKYMNYISDGFDVVFESNDVLTDFRIMNNARVLVCSLSTLSWCAGLLSKNVEKIYFPNNPNSGENQSFVPPLDQTIMYDPQLISGVDLMKLFP